MQVGGRVQVGDGRVGGRGEHGVVHGLADQRRLGLAGPHGQRVDAGERDAGLGDGLAVQAHDGGDAGHGEVAVPPGDLLEGGTGAGRERTGCGPR